ncbi:MAG: hypothetical protein ABI178_03065 [Rhodanobacter sp.]
MNALKRQVWIMTVLVPGMLFCGIASAATVVMNFDQLNSQGEYVDNYYNGGCGSTYAGGTITCGGPDYGVVWSGALAGGAPNGYYNNASNEPSQPNVMDFVGDYNNAVMNVAAGFTGGFSFYYSSPYYTGSIDVYSSLNGTGSLLASLILPQTLANCDGASENYSCWNPIGVAFTGTAESVAFGGTFQSGQGYIVFDNITLGSGTPMNNLPEPAALGIFGRGALLIGLFVGGRRRVA